MNKIINLLIVAFAFLGIILGPRLVWAADTVGPLGSVDNPLDKISDHSYGGLTGERTDGSSGSGLVGFVSNIVKLITVFCGIFAMFNFIIAGLDYITSQGDPKGVESARNKIKNSVIGLVIIVGTFSLTAIASYILFGKWDAILRPTIYGPKV